tara:strand:- start:54 stop:242 length:189 start_codon:yes stop_codon:yes gene_type:complete
MNIKPNPFESEIFEAYRVKQKKIKKAVRFLQKNGYKVYKETKVAEIPLFKGTLNELNNLCDL